MIQISLSLCYPGFRGTRSELWKRLSRRDYLGLIRDALTRYRLPLRFLIASRPECAASGSVSLFGLLETSASFSKMGFNKIHNTHRRTMAAVAKPWPSAAVLDLLVQKACGQFIYASTVLKFVAEEFDQPSRRLDLIMDLNARNRNFRREGDQNPFSDLDQLYRHVIGTNPDTNLVMCVLGAIITLNTPLPESDIETLLFLQRGDVALAQADYILLFKFRISPGYLSSFRMPLSSTI